MGLQQRMARLYPVDVRTVDGLGLIGAVLLREQCLGMDEVYVGKETVGVEHRPDIRSDDLGDLGEDAHYLTALVALQLTDAVVGLHDLCGLDIYRLARGALVMDDTRYLSLQSRCHRDDKTAVANCRRDILLDDTLALRRSQDAVQRTGDGALGAGQLTAYLVELG